jgi:hypothetical protein
MEGISTDGYRLQTDVVKMFNFTEMEKDRIQQAGFCVHENKCSGSKVTGNFLRRKDFVPWCWLPHILYF